MRSIFVRRPPRRRPWYRWLAFPFLLARWAWREAQEGADELWDDYRPA